MKEYLVRDFFELKQKGLITLREHPTFSLLIANYTPKVAYDGLWDDYPLLLECRGLVIDSTTGKVVARPWSKFFNYDEPRGQEDLKNFSKSFRAYDKKDGSLGILFFYKDRWILTTRGDFTSDQALKGNELLKNFETKYLNKEYTYLVEIIYPENRICVDYQDLEDLVMLGARNTQTGEEISLDSINWPSKTFYYGQVSTDNIDILLESSIDRSNREGFVLVDDVGKRVKVKYPEYIELHRSLTNISKKNIWKGLRDKQPLSKTLSFIPDEFFREIDEIEKELKIKFTERHQALLLEYTILKKELAEKILESPNHSYLFNFFKPDWDNIDQMIWNSLEPGKEKEIYSSTVEIEQEK